MAFKSYLVNVYPDTVESGSINVNIKFEDVGRGVVITKTYKLFYANYGAVQAVKDMIADERSKLNQMYTIKDNLTAYIGQEIT